MRFEYLGPCNEKVNILFDENVKLKARLEKYELALKKISTYQGTPKDFHEIANAAIDGKINKDFSQKDV
jgi:hypothetical protein